MQLVLMSSIETQTSYVSFIHTQHQCFKQNCRKEQITPQPLYNTIVGIQASFRVSYPNRVITRVKCISYIGKEVLNCHLGSNPVPCYIQNRVITNRVIKRFRCNVYSSLYLH